MLKIQYLDRALRYVEHFGNPSDAGKPTTPGERAARILDAQTNTMNLTDRAFSWLTNRIVPNQPKTKDGFPM